MYKSSLLVGVLVFFFQGLFGAALVGHVASASDVRSDSAFLTHLAEERERECLGPESGLIDPVTALSCAVELDVWREDLNGDGGHELIVYVNQRGTCGSAGCGLELYERRDGEWVLLTTGSAFGRPEVFDDTASEWPILVFFGFSGRIWRETERGGEYVWFCVSESCRFFHGGEQQ